MKELFKADFKAISIYDIDFLDLKSKGFSYALLDIDNTLVGSYDELPDERTITLINHLKDIGIKPIVFSNNTKKRVSKFCDILDIPYYYFVCKPFSFMYKRILKKYNIHVSEILSIGDQICTDIYGSKKVGIYAIETKPLKKDSFLTRTFNRKIERFIKKYILHE